MNFQQPINSGLTSSVGSSGEGGDQGTVCDGDGSNMVGSSRGSASSNSGTDDRGGADDRGDIEEGEIEDDGEGEGGGVGTGDRAGSVHSNEDVRAAGTEEKCTGLKNVGGVGECGGEGGEVSSKDNEGCQDPLLAAGEDSAPMDTECTNEDKEHDNVELMN